MTAKTGGPEGSGAALTHAVAGNPNDNPSAGAAVSKPAATAMSTARSYQQPAGRSSIRRPSTRPAVVAPDELLAKARQEAAAFGLYLPDHAVYSKSGRFPGANKGSSNTAGWWIWGDGCIHLGDFSTGATHTTFATAPTDPEQAAAQRREARRRQVARDKAEAETQRHAIATARAVVAECVPVTGCAYTRRKGVQPVGALWSTRHNAILIPLYLRPNVIVSCQIIHDNGSKRFAPGCPTKGAYFPVGEIEPGERLLVCEGAATAWTLHEETGHAVLASMTAGNLLSVATYLRQHMPETAITIAADDDRQTAGNPGRSKAIEAATAIGAKIAFPALCKACRCTDFNDATQCHRRRGGGAA